MSNYSIPVPHAPVNSFSLKVSIEPLFPHADLVLRFYTVRSPSGFREVEFHCNRAAITPLLKCGWVEISVRTEVAK